ncbi:unnamed protein product [Sphenostylis stenocarpa]|uniref:MSP domain-containing protein n=1 Tax=Sphenostylis stenocarpa TaxID=92480 RepID=A0AA86SLG2_9FABA|nr:unnamed protein product [Sphenostylis stenocarpa]
MARGPNVAMVDEFRDCHVETNFDLFVMTASVANSLITVNPDELRFQVELDKQTYCDLKVLNNTEHYVAFKVKTTSPKKYFVRPNTGVVHPWDSCIIRVTLQALQEYPPDMQCKDKFLLQSTVVNPNTDVDDLPPDTFTKDSEKSIEDLKLRVVYISPTSPNGSTEYDTAKTHKLDSYSSDRTAPEGGERCCCLANAATATGIGYAEKAKKSSRGSRLFLHFCIVRGSDWIVDWFTFKTFTVFTTKRMISLCSEPLHADPFLPLTRYDSLFSMEAFFNSQSSSRSRWSYDTLKNFREISPVVRNHIKRVYFTLCCAVVAAAVGAFLHVLWNIGGFLTTVGSIGTMVWLLSTPPFEEQKRLSLLMASALFQGASIGPLIELAIAIDPSLIFSAFVATSLAFGCFSAAALVARRREYLYLGGLLSSGLSILMWLHFASSLFGGSIALFKFELYFGLLVFVGYVIVDTQEIIEMAHFGDLDYVKHALNLFTDLVAIFVRILIIMLKNSSERNERKKKRRD